VARDGQVSALALFSGELRQARSQAGLTQDQLAEKLSYSTSLVAHVETGSRAPSLDFAARADEALGTGGLLTRLQPFVRAEAYPAWFRDWVEIEREATSLRWFEPLLIPGLLQTEDYARAVLAAAHPGLAGQFVIAGVRRCGGRRLPGQCPGRPGRGAGRRRGQGDVALRHSEGGGATPAGLH